MRKVDQDFSEEISQIQGEYDRAHWRAIEVKMESEVSDRRTWREFDKTLAKMDRNRLKKINIAENKYKKLSRQADFSFGNGLKRNWKFNIEEVPSFVKWTNPMLMSKGGGEKKYII